MRKYVLAAGLVFLSVIAFASKVEDRGKAWLDEQKDPPGFNVTGTWTAEDWGALQLTQAEGSRDVTGKGGKYELVGAVSGKRLFLIFHIDGNVKFCATLNSDADNNLLSGTYSYRVTRLKFGHGLCQDKSYRMQMVKK
jgi:hypothetical protein